MPKTFTDNASPTILVATGESTTAETVTLVAAVVGKKTRITALDAFCDNANSNDTSVEFLFGSTTVRKHAGVAAGSGFVVGSGADVLSEGPTNTALKVTVENPGGKVTYAVTYYQADG